MCAVPIQNIVHVPGDSGVGGVADTRGKLLTMRGESTGADRIHLDSNTAMSRRALTDQVARLRTAAFVVRKCYISASITGSLRAKVDSDLATGAGPQCFPALVSEFEVAPAESD